MPDSRIWLSRAKLYYKCYRASIFLATTLLIIIEWLDHEIWRTVCRTRGQGKKMKKILCLGHHQISLRIHRRYSLISTMKSNLNKNKIHHPLLSASARAAKYLQGLSCTFHSCRTIPVESLSYSDDMERKFHSLSVTTITIWIKVPCGGEKQICLL